MPYFSVTKWLQTWLQKFRVCNQGFFKGGSTSGYKLDFVTVQVCNFFVTIVTICNIINYKDLSHGYKKTKK